MTAVDHRELCCYPGVLMSDGKTLEIEANKRGENPYWTAFRLLGNEGRNVDFMAWIGRQWEALRAKGIKDSATTDKAYRAMLAHLEAQIEAR